MGETLRLLGEFIGEADWILEVTQTHPPENQHLKGHNLLVGSKRSDGKWGWSGARQHHNVVKRVAVACQISKALPL